MSSVTQHAAVCLGCGLPYHRYYMVSVSLHRHSQNIQSYLVAHTFWIWKKKSSIIFFPFYVRRVRFVCFFLLLFSLYFWKKYSLVLGWWYYKNLRFCPPLQVLQGLSEGLSTPPRVWDPINRMSSVLGTVKLQHGTVTDVGQKYNWPSPVKPELLVLIQELYCWIKTII